MQKTFGEVLKISLQSAFNVESPSTLTDEEKQAVLGGSASLEEICSRLKEGVYKKVLVMAGAGISVSAGIPDFRTPGTGLYAKLDLKRFNLPYPQAVFDIEYFQRNPAPFFEVAKHLYPDNFNPTPTHYFIKLLADKGLLLRCYTQVNIILNVLQVLRCLWCMCVYVYQKEFLCMRLKKFGLILIDVMYIII